MCVVVVVVVIIQVALMDIVEALSHSLAHPFPVCVYTNMIENTTGTQ